MKTANLISAIVIGGSCAVFSFPAASQEAATKDQVAAEKRVDFLQQHFSQFVPVRFQKDTNSEAVIQLLHARKNLFEYEGAYYCGFKFTVPKWLDGDFEWMWLLAKTEANKDFISHTLNWYIIPETEGQKDLSTFTVVHFPNTRGSKHDFHTPIS